jgi:predicted ATPase
VVLKVQSRARATGAELRLPYYLALLGRAQVRAGRRDEAAAALADGFAVAERNAESWTLPGLHLLQGDVLLSGRPRGRAEAETCFGRAVSIAREQGAVSLVLRATLALARLWVDLGRRHEARDALAPICAGFTEGLETPDLIEARALLDSLA